MSSCPGLGTVVEHQTQASYWLSRLARMTREGPLGSDPRARVDLIQAGTIECRVFKFPRSR